MCRLGRRAQGGAASTTRRGGAAREAAVIQVERARLAAQQPTDVAALARILASDFVHVFASGLVTEAQELAYDRAHLCAAGSTRRRFERLRGARVYGHAAIANGVVKLSRIDGPQKISRCGCRQRINSQETDTSESEISDRRRQAVSRPNGRTCL
ncbi:MAG TPA: nuclear transport factor 2 family protein [Terriglobales bacterium]|nr:nuclear transport factor 2 family protein [Terriglobales bacterium]